MIYSISYDLKKAGQDYSGLISTIKTLGNWAKPCESYWLLSTNLSASEVFAHVKPHIDANDRLLIVRVDLTDRAGWLTQNIWDWVNQQSTVTQY